jgi:GAF domain
MIEEKLYTTLEYQALQKDFFEKEKAMQERIWLDNNLNQYDEILRENFGKNIDEFTQTIINYISEFTNSFQTIFYLYNQETDLLDAKFGYACNLDYINIKNYRLGEGQVGQCFTSKRMLVYDDLPPNSVQLKTATTIKASATVLITTPIIFNTKVLAVIELVFIEKVEKKYLDWLQIISRNTAVVLESIRNSSLTQKLLIATQEQAETLQAQEEEVRQNLEELMATQETVAQKQRELEKAKERLEISDAILKKALEASKVDKEIMIDQNKKLVEAEIDLQKNLEEAKKNELLMFERVRSIQDKAYKQVSELKDSILQKDAQIQELENTITEMKIQIGRNKL